MNSTALLCAAAGTPQEKETLDSSLVARAQWRWSRSLLTVIPTLRRSSYRQHQLAHIIAQCCRSWAGPGYRELHSYTPPPAPSTNSAHSGACFALLWGGGLLLNFPLFLESTAATPFHCQHLAPDKSQMIFILTETRFLLTLQFYTKST